MSKKSSEWADAAWLYYSQENPPPENYEFRSRHIFMAGYMRGRAANMGLAWLYCTLCSIFSLIAIVSALIF